MYKNKWIKYKNKNMNMMSGGTIAVLSDKCPQQNPYFCTEKSNAYGLCRKTEYECNFSLIKNEKNIIPEIESLASSTKFGYIDSHLADSCVYLHLVYEKKFFDGNFIQKVPKKFSILTMNIWGLEVRNLVKYSLMKKRMNEIKKLIKKHQPDIVCFQEMSQSSFNLLHDDTYLKDTYVMSEDDIKTDDLLIRGNRTLETFTYSKFKPLKVQIYNIGGNLGYQNSIVVSVYENLIVINCYFQAGSKYSPGQENKAVHYHRCRKEQFQNIMKLIDQINNDNLPLIICGDFNTDLNDNGELWYEMKHMKKLNLIDSYKSKNTDVGYTENTDINHMRWNIKQMEKKFRYDGIFHSSNVETAQSYIVGDNPIQLTQNDSEIVKEYLKKEQLDKDKIKYSDKNNELFDWWASDHFGVLSEVVLL